MPKRSFANTVYDARLMLNGLKQHAERLSRRGLDTDFLGNYETTLDAVQTLDNEQERLKAEQLAKTRELNAKLKELNQAYSEARKTVKLEMEPTTWKEFGIQDKR